MLFLDKVLLSEKVVFKEKPLCIGAYPPLAGWHANFIGAIDDVAIYKKALTEEEIQRDMEGIKAAAVFPSGKLATSWGKIKTQL